MLCPSRPSRPFIPLTYSVIVSSSASDNNVESSGDGDGGIPTGLAVGLICVVAVILFGSAFAVWRIKSHPKRKVVVSAGQEEQSHSLTLLGTGAHPTTGFHPYCLW